MGTFVLLIVFHGNMSCQTITATLLWPLQISTENLRETAALTKALTLHLWHRHLLDTYWIHTVNLHIWRFTGYLIGTSMFLHDINQMQAGTKQWPMVNEGLRPNQPYKRIWCSKVLHTVQYIQYPGLSACLTNRLVCLLGSSLCDIYKVWPGGQIRPRDEFYAACSFILELYFKQPAQLYGTFSGQKLDKNCL